MAKTMTKINVISLLIIIAVSTSYNSVFAAQHIVGGSSGWTNFGVNYATWSSGQTFVVGDTLLFNYDSGSHQVSEVSQSDYNSCVSSNAIQTYDDGSTTITLSKAGTMNFICPSAGHCSSGMKLAVNVVAATNSSTTTPTTSPPSSTTPTTSTASAPPPPKSGVTSLLSGVEKLVLIAVGVVVGFMC